MKKFKHTSVEDQMRVFNLSREEAKEKWEMDKWIK